MKMSDTFELPVNGVAHHVSIEQNEAAAHAINYHDELVSTLEEALSMIERQTDFNDDGDGLLISRCKQALAKARGEL
jgi:hypothetical protein